MDVVVPGDRAGVAQLSAAASTAASAASRVGVAVCAQIAERGQRAAPGPEVLRRDAARRSARRSSSFTSGASTGFAVDGEQPSAALCEQLPHHAGRPAGREADPRPLPDFAGKSNSTPAPRPRRAAGERRQPEAVVLLGVDLVADPDRRTSRGCGSSREHPIAVEGAAAQLRADVRADRGQLHRRPRSAGTS